MQPDGVPVGVSGAKHCHVPRPFVVLVNFEDRGFLELWPHTINERLAVRFSFPRRDIADEVTPFPGGAGFLLDQVDQDPTERSSRNSASGLLSSTR